MKSKRIFTVKKSFSSAGEAFLAEATSFIREALTQLNTPNKLLLKVEMLSEEAIVQFAAHAPEGAALQVRVSRFLGDASVVLSMPGEGFDPFAAEEPESEDAIRAILFRSWGEKFKYRNKNRVNRARIMTGQSERSMIRLTLTALALGLLDTKVFNE